MPRAAPASHVTLDCVVDDGSTIAGGASESRPASGIIECDRAIVTIPTSCLAAGAIGFLPDLPDKLQAASRLPLGLNDKLFLSLAKARKNSSTDSRIFGATDRGATAAYHMRPFGRPQIEGYFGGSLACDLEASGDGAFFEFARDATRATARP